MEMAGPALFNKALDRSEFRPSEVCLDFEIRRMNYGAIIIIIMKEFESAPRNMLDTEVAKARVVHRNFGFRLSPKLPH